MTDYFVIHPETPQLRLIKQVVEKIKNDAVCVIPTDAAYVLACQVGSKTALDRIRRLRQLDETHYFTLLCRDLSDLGTYAQVSNSAYRFLKSLIPGAFTFILPATKEVPKRLLHPKRKTVGLRVSQNTICEALLAEMGEPLLITTLILPGEEWPLHESAELRDRMDGMVDVIIDGGSGSIELTTVFDLTSNIPEIIRQGKGILV